MGKQGWTKRVFDRLETTGLIVEISEIVAHEGDEPHPLVHLTHAHLLSGKHLAQIHFASFEAEAAAVRNCTRPVVERVVELAEAAIRAM